MKGPGVGQSLCRNRLLAVAATGLVATIALPQSSASASAKPEFQMPFACGESWHGSTRPTHSPSRYAVDWTRSGHDLGHIVTATGPGVVSTVANLGNTSYGRYVVIDHASGWSSLYAHLRRAFVVPGQRVDLGQTVGRLGSTGNSTGPHLHYEQRLDRIDRPAAFGGTRFAYNSWLSSRNCGDVPITGDWNGDQVTELGVFGRRPKSAVFRERLPNGSVSKVEFGRPTSTPVVGDWNGDGQSDPGVWSTPDATFTLLTPSGRRRVISFGGRRDLPVVGDWNGDGRSDIGTYHPATATFTLRDAAGNVTTRVFGSVSALPVIGDWDGDGRSDVGVYNPATSTFSLALPSGTTKTVVYGTPRSLPVIGNWNSDSVSDLGVWDTGTGVFAKRLSAQRTVNVRFGHIR
jgi:hypothetical protein